MFPLLSQNRLKFFQKLNQKKYRDREGLYIISGLRALQGAVSADNPEIETIIVAESRQSLLGQLNLRNSSIPVQLISEKDFAVLSDEKTPQGICAILRKPETVFKQQNIKEKLLFYFDRINDPGNLGTVIRSAAWFGIKSILLSPESADPFQPKAVRSSAGSITSMNIYENVQKSDLMHLKKTGYRVYATNSDEGTNLDNLKSTDSAIIMMGSEAHGLDQNIFELADHRISIARLGNGESLNLAIAASIIMFQATKTSAGGFK
ncbi:MAG: RNA methyltransferase [Calditrichaeota bacterium]|nr:RNA methyltransferase [Calditrichota bacterium]